MAQGGYADSIVSGMLGWLKGFASWVLKLFDLAGRGGVSPLQWLSNNWLSMLIFLVVVGIAADWIVWLIRWRPHWVWFRKKRVIVDDDDFFVGEDVVDSGLYDAKIFGRDAIRQSLAQEPGRTRAKADGAVPARRRPTTPRPDAVRRPIAGRSGPIGRPNAAGRPRPTGRPGPTVKPQAAEKPDATTKPIPTVKPGPAGRSGPAEKSGRHIFFEKVAPPEAPKPAAPSKRRPARRRPAEERIHPNPPSADIFDGDLFRIEPGDKEAQKLWEDDVFNVSNLPGADKPKLRIGIPKKREEDNHDDPFRID